MSVDVPGGCQRVWRGVPGHSATSGPVQTESQCRRRECQHRVDVDVVGDGPVDFRDECLHIRQVNCAAILGDHLTYRDVQQAARDRAFGTGGRRSAFPSSRTYWVRSPVTPAIRSRPLSEWSAVRFDASSTVPPSRSEIGRLAGCGLRGGPTSGRPQLCEPMLLPPPRHRKGWRVVLRGVAQRGAARGSSMTCVGRRSSSRAWVSHTTLSATTGSRSWSIWRRRLFINRDQVRSNSPVR